MPRTVRFLTECAGRKKGAIETVNDDTLAQDWVDAKHAEFVSTPSPAPQSKAPSGPPVDRAVRKAPVTK